MSADFCVRALLSSTTKAGAANTNAAGTGGGGANSTDETYDCLPFLHAGRGQPASKRPRIDSGSDHGQQQAFSANTSPTFDPPSLSTPSTSTGSASHEDVACGGDPWRHEDDEKPKQHPAGGPADENAALRSLCDSLKRRVSDDLGRIVDALMAQLVRNLHSDSSGHLHQIQLPQFPQPIFYPQYPPLPPPYFWPSAAGGVACPWQRPLDEATTKHAAAVRAAENDAAMAAVTESAALPLLAPSTSETPRKKRAKVTDIRCSGSQQSAAAAIPQFDSRSSTPNAPALHGQNLQPSFPHADQVVLHETEHAISAATLSPLHLRKAKLMFFYTRYPSTATLRQYFPDVQFNKSNTAQVVKWFSNFREFFYIQVEKFARQAVSAAITAASTSPGCHQPVDPLRVTRDTEIYRVLNAHFNRNNLFLVPSQFVTAVETAVREFHAALVARRDQDQSWKKPIYKVVARLDCNPPDAFKQPAFPEATSQ